MASKIRHTQNRQQGFTLLETLVALGIASILIATLIPISRNTLFRIATLSEQAAALAVIERVTNSNQPLLSSDRTEANGISLRVTKSSLPQFSYPRDQRDQWQPVLYKVEARGRWGSITQTEIIRIERASQ